MLEGVSEQDSKKNTLCMGGGGGGGGCKQIVDKI
jgi:hypothetical protein